MGAQPDGDDENPEEEDEDFYDGSSHDDDEDDAGPEGGAAAADGVQPATGCVHGWGADGCKAQGAARKTQPERIHGRREGQLERPEGLHHREILRRRGQRGRGRDEQGVR
eukprot:5514859-Pyramimonas_sp.AAC.1